MNELIQKVCERTGLSQDKAQQAVQVVIEQLKSRMPASLAGELDKYASGEGTGDIGSKLGSIFGKKTA